MMRILSEVRLKLEMKIEMREAIVMIEQDDSVY